MSVYRDMAKDAGCHESELDHMAAHLEQQHMEEMERNWQEEIEAAAELAEAQYDFQIEEAMLKQDDEYRTLFMAQVNKFTRGTGIVFYIEKHVPQWSSPDECYNDLLENLRTINEHDPMQHHGVKTDEELQDMARKGVVGRYEFDQECQLVMKTAAIVNNEHTTPEDLEDQRRKVESSELFVRWWDNTERTEISC